MFDWKKINVSDGYFARLEFSTGSARLFLGFQVNNKIQKARVVLMSHDLDVFQIGDMKRKLIVLEAIAEYLNAGGYVEELVDLLPQKEEGSLWAEGWHYYDGGVEPTTGNRVHEFVDDKCETFVRWVRHEFIDTDLTLEDISNDQLKSSPIAAFNNQIDSKETGQADCQNLGFLGP